MSKRSDVVKSICRNVCSVEQCMCRNVPVIKYPMTVAEMFHAEMVVEILAEGQIVHQKETK